LLFVSFFAVLVVMLFVPFFAVLVVMMLFVSFFAVLVVMPLQPDNPVKRAGPQYNAEAHISEPIPPMMTLKNFNPLNGMRPVHISVSQQNI